MANEAIIQFKNVSFAYLQEEDGSPQAEKLALDDVSFDIQRGSFVAIVGSNGSGKSTLAKHMNALLLPTSGNVLIEGVDTGTASDEAPWEIRKKVGITDGLIRLSIGIEDIDDILADIEQAIEKAEKIREKN